VQVYALDRVVVEDGSGNQEILDDVKRPDKREKALGIRIPFIPGDNRIREG
jgi:hypothetical protein